MPEILRYPVSVIDVKEIKTTTSGRKDADDKVTLTEISIGWYITLSNGFCLPCGDGKPELKKGDTCRLTLERYP